MFEAQPIVITDENLIYPNCHHCGKECSPVIPKGKFLERLKLCDKDFLNKYFIDASDSLIYAL